MKIDHLIKDVESIILQLDNSRDDTLLNEGISSIFGDNLQPRLSEHTECTETHGSKCMTHLERDHVFLTEENAQLHECSVIKLQTNQQFQVDALHQGSEHGEHGNVNNLQSEFCKQKLSDSEDLNLTDTCNVMLLEEEQQAQENRHLSVQTLENETTVQNILGFDAVKEGQRIGPITNETLDTVKGSTEDENLNLTDEPPKISLITECIVNRQELLTVEQPAISPPLLLKPYLPTLCHEINFDVLKSGVAYLSGARDRSGRGVVIVTTRNTVWLNPHCNIPKLVYLLVYFYSLPRQETQSAGLTILVDARRCSPVSALFKAFNILQNPVYYAVIQQVCRPFTLNTQSPIVKTKEKITAVFGESLSFTCTTNLNDILQVTWQKLNGQTEENIAIYNEKIGPKVFGPFMDSVSILTSKLQESTLVLSGVRHEDKGCYQCLFTTFPDGSNIGKTCLNVLAKSPHEETQENKTAVISADVNFSCTTQLENI
ncbi:uncharacterized protein [Mobula birostris]|uniref:uncharacterized protein n=1 Tax=Mobula birostris TaxID=1983395 RepID=UPI003B2876D0